MNSINKIKKSVAFGLTIVLIGLILISLVGFVISESETKTIVDKDGIIKIKGNDYNVKSGSTFIVGSNGLTEGTNFVTGGNGGIYNLKGVEYSLPEKTKVLFKDGKIIISLPDGTIFKDPKIVNGELAKNAVFEIKPEKGNIKIGKDSFDGTISYEIDEKGIHSYIIDEKCSLGGLAISQKKGEKTELFLDGDRHGESKGAYLSVGESLVIGKNSEGKGADIRFNEGNRFLNRITAEQQVIMSAGRDADDKNSAEAGTIKITNRGDIAPEVVTEKSFRIENGELVVKAGKDSKGNGEILTSLNDNGNGKKSYGMEIEDERFNNDGKKYKYVIDGNNQGDIFSFDEKPITLDKDIKKEQNQNSVVGINIGGQGEIPGANLFSVNNDPNSGLVRKGTGIRVNPNANMLQLVESLTRDRDNSDVLTKVHEEGHWANMDVTTRNGVFADYSPDQRKTRAFLTGEIDPQTNEPVQIQVQGTGVRKSQTANYVPNSFRDDYYSLYYGNVHSNKDAVHVFEDLSAYHLETKYSSETLNVQNANGAVNEFKSVIHAASVGMYMRDQDQNYWNGEGGKQFRSALSWGSEESMKYLSSQSNVVNALRSNPDTKAMRGFLIETYGAQWTQKVFGFNTP